MGDLHEFGLGLKPRYSTEEMAARSRVSATEFPTDEKAAAIADEADIIIIRSLESRVAKMEKSDASALNVVPYRFAYTPVACHMVMFWCELGIFRTTQLENSAGSLNHGHDSSFATLQDLKILGPGAVPCFVY